MFKKPTLLLLVFFGIGLAIVTVTVLRGQNQRSTSERNGEEATPVQEGVMTEVAQQHSQLHKLNYINKRKLTDYSVVIERVYPPPWVEASSGNKPVSTEGPLRGAACGADAVIVGLVNKKSSSLTEDGYSVFTDYVIVVEELVKENANAALQASSSIIVTRHGGVVRLNGKIIRVIDKTFLPFQLDGKYLLFLRYIPATGAYQALDSESSFELGQHKVGRLSEQRSSHTLDDQSNPLAFLGQVRAVAAGCQKTGGLP